MTQSILKWLTSPTAAYTPVDDMMFAPAESFVVMPNATYQLPSPVDMRGDPSLATPDVDMSDFPSLMTLFGKAKNVFGT